MSKAKYIQGLAWALLAGKHLSKWDEPMREDALKLAELIRSRKERRGGGKFRIRGRAYKCRCPRCHNVPGLIRTTSGKFRIRRFNNPKKWYDCG